MKKTVFILALLLLCFIWLPAQVKLSHLLCENNLQPIGLDVTKPRFSWQLSGLQKNILQTAYEIRVAEDNRFKNLVWQSGKVSSGQSVHIPYGGKTLASGLRYYWQVRVWDQSGKVSSWSEIASWQMGLLQASDWKAKWITVGYTEDSILRPSPLMRKKFSISKKLKSATAYITAHGLYEAYLNGKRVGDAYLTPGWTSYKNRLQYQAYDITGQVQSGANAICVMLGSGWYRGIIGFSNNQNVYGRDISLLLQIDLLYADGSRESITTDESWKSSTGAVRYAEIYNGETIDANLDQPGWNNINFDDSKWNGVSVLDFDKKNLVAMYNEPVRSHEVFKPLKIFTTPKGEQVIDFGQNLVGWVQLKVRGKKGDTITVRHAEVLDKYGNFYTENLREARATDNYILKGSEEEIFEPHFTFHGFRYIQLEGYPGTIQADNLKAIALYSDMASTGSFTCSNPLLNQLQHNIQWGQRGNFLDVPTDCPQRDERLGWTGDAQVFSRTAAFNMNVNNFFAKWLKDLAADQGKNGAVPFVIPNILGNVIGATGWADAATIIPWNMYLAYGDKRILETQYLSMKAWVDHMEKNSRNDLWNVGFHFGDWLSYMQDNDLMGRSAITDKYLIAQCFWAHSTDLLIKTARLLGKTEDVSQYENLQKRIRAAFVKEYVSQNGRLVSGTQTAYVLALWFDMLPDEMRPGAVDRLVENIRNYNNHLSTGFLGTPYLCHVLSRFGKTDIAYTLLLQETFPSWLYPVKMGATTIWERWNGIRPDSSFEPASMNSFNHYAYGAIGDWMYRVMVGLDTEEEGAGFKKIIVKPHIGGGLTRASVTLETYYGKIQAGWQKDNGRVIVTVEIPANTTARVFVPAGSSDKVTENGKPINTASGIRNAGMEEGYAVFEIGSGSYSFEAAP